MSTEDKWTAALQKLTKLTNDGAIVWETVPFDQVPDAKPDKLIGKYYTTMFLGKSFLVYEYSYQYYVSETDSYVPTKEVRVYLVDTDFNFEFRVPEVESRWKLLEAIRSQSSGADDFLDDLLKLK